MGEMEERGFVTLLDKVQRERGLDCRQYSNSRLGVSVYHI